jgi:predicted protein tyrosine phosphatase
VDNINNVFFICINSTKLIHSIPYFKEKHDNVINLYFDDVLRSGPKEEELWFTRGHPFFDRTAMSKEQGEELVNFISKIPNNSEVYVYCAKGQSRSGAVEDFLMNRPVSSGSNSHVYNTLKVTRDARL